MADGIRIELIRSLYATISPSLIMSGGFALSAAMICSRVQSGVLVALGIAGTATNVLRLGFVFSSASEARSNDLTVDRARLLERRFAITFFCFAAILGAFAAQVFTVDAPEVHMLAVCLLVGYAAGVSAGAGLRPWIAVPSMTVAVAPTSLAILCWGDSLYRVTGLLMAAFLAGGIHSLRVRYRSKTMELAQRITFGRMANRDALTELPNRIALAEWFEVNVADHASRGLVAVHYLDLNGFKPVNDRFGHPVGDELLRAVSARLAAQIRAGDVAARLGGDEFAIIQSDLHDDGEAEILALRLCEALEAPFRIREHEIRISGSIGFVTSPASDADLEAMLGEADEALYLAKRSGSTIVAFETGSDPLSVAA